MGTEHGQIGRSAGFSYRVLLMGMPVFVTPLGDQVGLRTLKSVFVPLLLTVKTLVCILWSFI